MALVQCPECGRKNVSSMAEACPDCGFPIRDYFERHAGEDPASDSVEQTEPAEPEAVPPQKQEEDPASVDTEEEPDDADPKADETARALRKGNIMVLSAVGVGVCVVVAIIIIMLVRM